MNAADVQVRGMSGIRWMLWIGRAVSLWPIYVVVSSATWKLTRSPWYVGEIQRIGWQVSSLDLLAFLQLSAIVLYAIPQTAVLGAVILTGYLGGAIATYVRIGEWYPPLVPLSTAMFAWLGLFLRDEKLRTLLPWRRLSKS
jgi:hypothetical protein